MRKNLGWSLSLSKGFTTFSFHERGFTLVELLTVLAIIAILAAFGFSSFSTVQSKARDAQRKNDITSIAKALEIHKIDSGYQELVVTWFEKGTKPKDPGSYVYCGCDDDPITTDLDNTTWTDATDCPTTAGTAGCDNSWKNVTADDFPVAVTGYPIYWRVCAHMESTTEVFCKHNVQ